MSLITNNQESIENQIFFPNATTDVPLEVCIHIFSYFSIPDVLICRLVCKSWKDITQALDFKFWQRYITSFMYPFPVVVSRKDSTEAKMKHLFNPQRKILDYKEKAPELFSFKTKYNITTLQYKNKQVFCGHKNNKFSLWNQQKKQVSHLQLKNNKATTKALYLGSTVIIGQSNQLKIRCLDQKKWLSKVELKSPATALTKYSDKLLMSAMDSKLSICDLDLTHMTTICKDTTTCLTQKSCPNIVIMRSPNTNILSSHNKPVVTMLQTYEHQCLIASSSTSCIKVIDIEKQAMTRSINVQHFGVYALQKSHNLILSVDFDNVIKLWDIRDGSKANFTLEMNSVITCLEFKGTVLIHGEEQKKYLYAHDIRFWRDNFFKLPVKAVLNQIAWQADTVVFSCGGKTVYSFGF